MQNINVTIIQDVLDWHDQAANRNRYDAHFNSITDTDLIVLPEMFSSGFSMHPEACFETMDGETVAWMCARASEYSAVITGSLIMKLADNYFVNRMIWAKPDGGMDYYDKRHLFRYGGEHLNFKSGDQRVVVELSGWRIALFVCYDLRFPVWSRNKDDYDVAIYVANWPNARQFAWDSLLPARAIENQAYVLGVNRLGEDALGNSFSGGSVILDYMGKPLDDCKDRLTVATRSLSMEKLNEFREVFPARLDADQFKID